MSEEQNVTTTEPVDGNDPAENKPVDTNETNPNPSDTGTSDASSAEGNGDDGKGTEGKEAEVPEAYDIKTADGIELDKEALDTFTPIAKDLKLSNDQAQKLADYYSGQLQKVHEAQREQYLKTIESWEEEAKKDPEIGGDKLQGAIQSAQRALKTYDADGSFTKLMDESGFGNHPAVMRFVSRVGKALKEDTADAHRSTRSQERDINKILYND